MSWLAPLPWTALLSPLVSAARLLTWSQCLPGMQQWPIFWSFLRALEAVVNTQHFLQEINHVSDSKTKSQFRSFLFRVSVPVLHIPSPEGFTNTTLIFPTCTCRQTSSVSHPQSCTRALKATRRAFQKVKSGSTCNLPYSPAKCFQ